MVKTHKDLLIWKKSIDFVTVIYKVTKDFPKEEIYGLVSQLRRATVSVPSNIAEGSARKGNQEFKQFLYIALASTSEIDTQLIISFNLNYINEEKLLELQTELNTIAKMLQGLIKSLDR